MFEFSYFYFHCSRNIFKSVFFQIRENDLTLVIPKSLTLTRGLCPSNCRQPQLSREILRGHPPKSHLSQDFLLPQGAPLQGSSQVPGILPQDTLLFQGILCLRLSIEPQVLCQVNVVGTLQDVVTTTDPLKTLNSRSRQIKTIMTFCQSEEVLYLNFLPGRYLRILFYPKLI